MEVWYSGTSLLQLAVWQFVVAGPLYVLQLTTLRVLNQQLWTFYPTVTWPRDGGLTFCAEDVRRLSFLCLRFSVGFRYKKDLKFSLLTADIHFHNVAV